MASLAPFLSKTIGILGVISCHVVDSRLKLFLNRGGGLRKIRYKYLVKYVYAFRSFHKYRKSKDCTCLQSRILVQCRQQWVRNTYMSNYSTNPSEFQAIVLAAGRGRRMGSAVPKVLLPLMGRPIIAHVLDVLAKVGIGRPLIVIGAHAEMVRSTLGEGYRYVVQPEQLGSGHAVLCARDLMYGQSRHVIVMCGDSPLFKTQTIRSLVEAHRSLTPAITLVSACLEDPTGYGRILRDKMGEITGVIEEVDASDEEKAIKEVNGGCYAFESEWLWRNLDSITENESHEKCLTQLVTIAVHQGRRIISVSAEPDEILGINTPEDLTLAEAILAKRHC